MAMMDERQFVYFLCNRCTLWTSAVFALMYTITWQDETKQWEAKLKDETKQWEAKLKGAEQKLIDRTYAFKDAAKKEALRFNAIQNELKLSLERNTKASNN